MNMMTAVAAVPAIAVLPTIAKAELSSDRTAWEAALATFQRVKAEEEAFDAIFDPLHDQFVAEVDAIPHKSFPPNVYSGEYRPSTENRFSVRVARRVVAEWDDGNVKVDEIIRTDYEAHVVACRALVEADEERWAARDAIDQRLGYSPACDKSERLCRRAARGDDPRGHSAARDGCERGDAGRRGYDADGASRSVCLCQEAPTRP